MDEDIEQSREAAHAATERVARAAHEGIDRVAKQGERAEEYVRDMGHYAGDRSRELARDVTEYLQEHPYAAIGAALAAGFVVGAMFRRR